VSRKYVGIEEARGILGDLVTAAQQGADIIITRNRRPAARLVAYQEDTMTIIDDQTHQEIVTGAEAAALRAAGIDADAITETPDGTVTVVRADGGRFAIGWAGADDDDPWWSGARYDDADGEQVASCEWWSAEDMAADVAAWWRRTA
jgi:prevent-host-death family protein